MATKFADLAKPAKDLLSDDFTDKFLLKAKKPAGPVAVTIETEQDKSGALISKVGTKFSYAKFNVDKGQMVADGSTVMETSLDVSPQLKLTFKTKKGADLGFEYVKGTNAFTGTVDVMEMSKLSGSGCMGLPSGLKLGMDATYTLAGGKGLTGFGYGFAYTAGPMFASVTATNKNAFTIGLLYKVSPVLSLASETVHTGEKLCNIKGIGAAYKTTSVGTIKAKMGHDGIFHACVTSEIAPKVTLTASGSFVAKDLSSFKPGLSLTM